ncbi:MAG: MFS transporter [Patescibacteria group bacterium]
MFKDNSQLNPKIKNIFFAAFLLSLHVALTAYVNSSLLSLTLSERSVGLLFTLGAAVAVIALLFIPQILRRFGGYNFLIWSVGLNALSLLLLATVENKWIIIPVFIFYETLVYVITFLLDELLQIFSKNHAMGKIRGLYIACYSVAWVVAQIFSGKVLHDFPFSAIYFISFAIMSIFFLTSFFFLRNLPEPKYDRAPLLGSLQRYFRNKNLSRAYKINFILQFFYAFMVIYTPIYLSTHLLFTWSQIGTIFAIMLTPFVFLPFPLGKYSDIVGERSMLMWGFFIASLATLSLFFITQHSVWIWALALFCTRLGAATIEIMSDTYFFKHITKEEDEFIGIYRNTAPVAYILAPLLALAIFAYSPAFNYIYLVLGALMLYGVYIASTIRRADL